MSPRPIEPDASRFEAALQTALAGRFSEAVHAIARAVGTPELELAHGDEAAHTLVEVARVARAAKDLHAADDALGAAVLLRPTHADLLYHRAMVQLAMARPSEGRALLERALAVNPRYAAARLERALLDAREGRLGEALGALRSLSSETRVNETRAFQRGMESLEQADWDEAAQHLRRALQGDEGALHDRIERAHDALRAGQFAAASEHIRVALDHNSTYPDLHALMGTAELRQGHLDDAMVSFARALELNPDYHAARLELARALEGLGLRVQALEQVALVLEQAPTQPQALELHAQWTGRTRHASGRAPIDHKRP